ncbi:hypothetical protein CRM22_006670 [Opisthorchis felineus]|uniref:Corticotropin-releasing factor domain-containing protein n=1 Tax=Opisthorchis felineus TaxID=147828 RepID=A0A4S2LRB0_OPIFE|nr:hypothetical protein CRM22_006670 [Opisthorchis felineus]TGZ63859.1 hypothetical protein CRM22_006670 [Opisthorchis felineus]
MAFIFRLSSSLLLLAFVIICFDPVRSMYLLPSERRIVHEILEQIRANANEEMEGTDGLRLGQSDKRAIRLMRLG